MKRRYRDTGLTEEFKRKAFDKDVCYQQVCSTCIQKKYFESMVYLGHMLTDDGKSDKEMKRGIEVARHAYRNLAPTLSSRDTGIGTRERIVKCHICARFLYGSET